MECIRDIEEELLCPICLEIFTKPILLQCNHTFCDQCVELFFKFSKRNYCWKIDCPICRSSTSVMCGINEKPITHLPRNYIVEGVISKFLLFKNNVPISSNISQEVTDHTDAITCRIHNKNLVKYFCKTCEILICRVCTIVNHRSHDLVFPHEVAICNQGVLESSYDKLKDCTEKISISIETLILTSKEIKNRRDEIIQQIHLMTARIVDVLKKRKDELIDETYQVTHTKLKKLSVQKDALQLEFGKSQMILKSANSSLCNGSAVEKLHLKRMIDEQLEHFWDLSLDPEEDDTIIYIHNEDDNVARKVLGRIEAKSTFADVAYAEGEDLETSRMDKISKFTVFTLNHDQKNQLNDKSLAVHIHDPDGTKIDNQIQSVENGQYQVLFTPIIKGKHKIEVKLRGRPIQKSPFYCNVMSKRDYQDINNIQLSLGIFGSGQKEFKSPVGITVNKNGELFVSDCHNHRIQMINYKGDVIKTFGSQGCRKGFLNNPSGVYYHDKSQSLYVCDTGNGRVQILDVYNASQEDSCLKTFIDKKISKQHNDDQTLKSPFGIDRSINTENIAISDPTNNFVNIYNADGLFCSKLTGLSTPYKSKHDKRLLFNTPTHVSFEPDTNLLYVSDTKNNRVASFDLRTPTGFVNMIESTKFLPINSPKGIAFDHASNLIIVNSGSNNILVINKKLDLLSVIGGSTTNLFKFSSPEDVCVTPNGDLAITDCCNNRIILL